MNASIAAGDRALDKLPIRFQAPKVTGRTDYTLSVKLQSPKSGVLEDRFAITVFPPAAKLRQPKARMWFIGADGQPDAFLVATGLQARVLSQESPRPRPSDLVIVLRGAFHSPEHDANQSYAAKIWKAQRLDDLVRDGLRVIVMEQNEPNLLGLNTEEVRPRRVFMSASTHPVFAGLEASDLTNWRGASDLEVDVPVANTPDLKTFPVRIWQVSNENSVATRTVLRPQVGAARALAVSGFGLQESPLLEIALGRGRLFFCQMDVSNRYGIDPAATRLANNLLGYAATAPAPNP